MTYSVLVTRRVRYRIEAASPDEAQALAMLAALGTDAKRTKGRVTVEGKTVVVDRAEVDTAAAGVVE